MQHDFDVDNANGAEVRGDINDALEAIVTLSSGNVAPVVKYPLQLWGDTNANKLKIRNKANTAWVIVGDLDAVGLGLAPLLNAALVSPSLSNPTITGTATATTPGTSDSSAKIATTAMVQLAAVAKAADAVGAINTVVTKVNGSNVTGRTININNSGPSGGANGDVWLEY